MKIDNVVKYKFLIYFNLQAINLLWKHALTLVKKLKLSNTFQNYLMLVKDLRYILVCKLSTGMHRNFIGKAITLVFFSCIMLFCLAWTLKKMRAKI